MKLVDYLKSHTGMLLCQLALIIVINAVLLSSTTLERSINDILYLNLLLIVICIIFLIYGYIDFRNKYGKLRKALNKNLKIDYLIPEDDSFHSVLLRDIVQSKCSEQLELVSEYKSNMDELNNYITKWVHEAKIPISVCELMLENIDTLEIETSRKFKAEMERIKFLVNQVLYASRASHYQEDFTVAEFSLQKAVREAIKLNSYFLMSKNIEVIPKNLNYSIVADQKWVIYILEQILNNASKYVKQDGQVEIYAYEDDKTVRLHIRDNGIGIPAADITRIFDKGFTGENGRKTSKSTGMGLYYAKKIANRLGIGLDVCSIEGQYTEFLLTFYKLSDYLNVTKI